MIVLEVSLNGELLTTAGQEDLCVLNTIVDAIGKLGPESVGTKTEKHNFGLSLHVGGLSAKTDDGPGQHLRWIPQREIEIGDQVCIRVLEKLEADKPFVEKQTLPVEDDELERKHWESARNYYLEFKAKYEQRDG